MKTVKVYFVGAEVGNCQVLYRTVPNRQLVCTLEESGTFTWMTCVDDDCWNEPISDINMDNVNIEVIDAEEAEKLIAAHQAKAS